MATKVYGCGDDLIEFEGDLDGEFGCYGSKDDDHLGILIAFSDGTILAARYGKPAYGGVWAIDVLNEGSLYAKHEVCTDPDAEIYSDVVHFLDGALKAWTGKEAGAVMTKRTVQEIIDDPLEDAALRQALQHNVDKRFITPLQTLPEILDQLHARTLANGELKDYLGGCLSEEPIAIRTIMAVLKDSCIEASRIAIGVALTELCAEGFAGYLWAPPKGSMHSARYFYDREAFENRNKGEDPWLGLEGA